MSFGTLWKAEDYSWLQSGAVPPPPVPLPNLPLTLQDYPIFASGAVVPAQFSGRDIYEIAVSGVRVYPTTTFAYVTYDSPQLGYQGNAAQFANQDEVPMFIFLGGDVKYARGRGGEIIVGNPDKPLGAG